MASSIDRFVAYVDSLEPGFSARLEPADPRLVSELESLYGGNIPTEYRAYLERLGGDAGGFVLYDQDESGLEGVVACYRPAARPRLAEAPRGGSILIARGPDDSLALDGREDPRPVVGWDGVGFFGRYADSLERYLFQRAWLQFSVRGLVSPRGEDVPAAGAAGLEKAAAAAGRRGLGLLEFSDGVQKLLEAPGLRVLLRLDEEGGLYVGAWARTEAEASSLARALAEESRG